MQDNDREIQAELDRQAHARDRFDFLDRMLNGYKYLVEEQVSRKQNSQMSRYQIRRINELLGDIRHFLREFEYTEYLQPAEEPEGEDGEGMSYSENLELSTMKRHSLFGTFVKKRKGSVAPHIQRYRCRLSEGQVRPYAFRETGDKDAGQDGGDCLRQDADIQGTERVRQPHRAQPH